MKPIATREDSARLSVESPATPKRPPLGRPPDRPEDAPKKRVGTVYRRHGTAITVRLKQSLCEALENTQAHLAQASGRTFSQPIFLRRALDLYTKSLLQMDLPVLTEEATVLIQQYR